MKFSKALLIGLVYVLATFFLVAVTDLIKLVFRDWLALILVALVYIFTIGFIVWFMTNDIDWKK